MITRFRLRDFKGHRDTELPLSRFTVLSGGRGKTSVLEALWLQSALAELPGNTVRDDWALDDLLRRGAPGPITLTTTAEGWSSEIELRAIDALRAWEIAATCATAEGSYAARLTGRAGGGAPSGDWPRLAATLGRAGLYRLDVRRIAAAGHGDEPEVDADGGHTAAVLAALRLAPGDVFEHIEATMRRLVPSLERVRVRPAIVREPDGTVASGSKLYFDFHGAPGVPAHAAGDGTSILLALITILHGPGRPRLVLLDNLGEALEPGVQVEVVRVLEQALEERGDLQIVATTHSSHIRDVLDRSAREGFACQASHFAMK